MGKLKFNRKRKQQQKRSNFATFLHSGAQGISKIHPHLDPRALQKFHILTAALSTRAKVGLRKALLAEAVATIADQNCRTRMSALLARAEELRDGAGRRHHCYHRWRKHRLRADARSLAMHHGYHGHRHGGPRGARQEPAGRAGPTNAVGVIGAPARRSHRRDRRVSTVGY